MKPRTVFAALTLAGLACSLTGPGRDAVGPGSEAEAPAEPTSTATPIPEPLIDAPGLAQIELTTPLEGAGVKPRFEWRAIEGAVSYTLVLYTPEGAPYWSWTGVATAVYLGGGDTPPPPDSAGPVLSPGMTWGVMAFNQSDVLVGTSARQPISP